MRPQSVSDVDRAQTVASANLGSMQWIIRHDLWLIRHWIDEHIDVFLMQEMEKEPRQRRYTRLDHRDLSTRFQHTLRFIEERHRARQMMQNVEHRNAGNTGIGKGQRFGVADHIHPRRRKYIQRDDLVRHAPEMSTTGTDIEYRAVLSECHQNGFVIVPVDFP